MSKLEQEIQKQIRECGERAAQVSGKPFAIQALWDGDTQGWFLTLDLVTGETSGAPFQRHLIDTFRYGGDLRLFNGQVPPWPEAAVAQAVGEQLAARLGVEFYFPSPEEADDTLPDWWEKETSPRCRTCGRPIASNRVVPAFMGQCVSCHSEDERVRTEKRRRNELLADAPGDTRDQGIYCVWLENGQRSASQYFAMGAARNGLLDKLGEVLRAHVPPLVLSTTIDARLAPASLAVVRDFCEREVDTRLAEYAPRCVGPLQHFARFAALETFRWRDQEHTVETYLNPQGSELYWFFRMSQFFRTDRAGETMLCVFGNGGVTKRDAAVLGRLRLSGGSSELPALHEAFSLLAMEELNRTLQKLEQRGFVERQGTMVRLTLKGHEVDRSAA